MEAAPTSQKATILMCTFTQLLYIETHSGAERGHSNICQHVWWVGVICPNMMTFLTLLGRVERVTAKIKYQSTKFELTLKTTRLGSSLSNLFKFFGPEFFGANSRHPLFFELGTTFCIRTFFQNFFLQSQGFWT